MFLVSPSDLSFSYMISCAFFVTRATPLFVTVLGYDTVPDYFLFRRTREFSLTNGRQNVMMSLTIMMTRNCCVFDSRCICVYVSLRTTHEAEGAEVAVAIGFQFGGRTADNGQGEGHKAKLGGTAAGLRSTGMIPDGRFFSPLPLFLLHSMFLYTEESGLW